MLMIRISYHSFSWFNTKVHAALQISAYISLDESKVAPEGLDETSHLCRLDDRVDARMAVSNVVLIM